MADEKKDEYVGRTVDFGDLSGNCLIAVNPEPWVQSQVKEKMVIDKREKMMGCVSSLPEGSEPVTGKTGGSKMGHIHDDDDLFDRFDGCESIKKNAKINPDSIALNKDSQESKEYKVGDVMFFPASRSDLTPSMNALEPYGDKEICVRLYQCVYVSDVSTLWGTVPVEYWTDAEKSCAGQIAEEPKGSSLYGIFKDRSEDMSRVATVSGQDVKHIGEEIDKYLEIEKEYTGDYLIADEKYGDNDGKAAFLLETFKSKTLGFFYANDMDKDYAGNGRIDCLHLNVGAMDPEKNRDYFFTTMLHEMQHYIIFGYNCGESDAWIDELMAQEVSRLSYAMDSEDVRSYTKEMVGAFKKDFYREDGVIHTYAFGYAYPDDEDYDTIFIYNTSYLLGEYLRTHVDQNFVKIFTTGFDKCTADNVSAYLKTTKGHCLEYYLACFDVALAANMDGVNADGTGTDYYMEHTWLLDYFRECRDKVFDSIIEPSGVLKSVTELKENKEITGAGAAKLFRSAKDCGFRIDDVQDGVVWALRNSKGEIVAVDGLEYYDDRYTFDSMQVKTMAALSDGMRVDITADIRCNANMIFNGYKKYSDEDFGIKAQVMLFDDKGRTVDVSHAFVPVIKQKNFKSVYTLSDNSVSDKKCPMITGFKLSMAKGMKDKDLKKVGTAINRAIKQEIKSKPMRFGIRPENVGRIKPEVSVNSKGRITKVVYMVDDRKARLKKTDYKPITNEAGEVIGIEGTGNYKGKYYLPGK
ncbi:MAG: hypothetical protein II799_02320 [Lachnospiraceae bacterium]|nr:hypothetical protein [Lachnospiraceae bacterium]